MAYQVRQKDPLLDSDMQAVLGRRMQECIGAGLLLLSVALVLMLATYHPEDPTAFAATEVQPSNMLGSFGATVSMALLRITGIGAWALAVACAVWGARLVTHKGAERALGRGVLVLPWAAVVAIYASTHVPPASWAEQNLGLGGLFGETALATFLIVLPIGSVLAVKLLSFLLFVASIVLGAFALGLDREEMEELKLFLLGGLFATIAALKAMRMPERKAKEEPTPQRSTQVIREGQESVAEPAQSTSAALTKTASLKATLMSRLSRKSAKVEQEEQLDFSAPYIAPIDDGLEGPDRVKARIANAIQGRVQRGEPVAPPPTRPIVRGGVSHDTDAHETELVEVLDEEAAFAEPEVAVPASPVLRREPTFSAPNVGHIPQEPQLRSTTTDAQDEIDAYLAAPMLDLSSDPSAAISAPIVPIEPEQPIPVASPSLAPEEPVAVTQPIIRAEPVETQIQKRPAPQKHNLVSDSNYEGPALSLLTDPISIERHYLSDDDLEDNARMLETVLDDYGVKGEIVSVRPGPVVTMYELEPAPGLKASRVIGLADDIARSMSALSARVSTVPGRSVIGIELPNEKREMVVLREMLAHETFDDTTMRLPLALGKDIGGAPVIANLAKMPHLLIAGTTGSGKSVAINTMILSLLYKLTPEDCRMIMIDPKMLELSVYDGIPHLLSPVVTDPKKAVVALKWVVGEMEERYRKMSKMGVRNIDGYNSRVEDALRKGEMFTRTVQTGFDDETGEPVFETEENHPIKLPYIVVVVDEMADLMMVAGKEIEACIQRLAQMARASGIHLIMATQRPSVDVITGTIKANFPTRISFHVTSKVDSRTILGEQGAEQLLGMGDMLYMAGGSKITRVHGPFCSDEEVEEVVNHLKSFGPPDYASSVLDGPDEEKSSDIDAVLGLGGNTNSDDAYYDKAVAIVAKDRKCSTSYIQRKLGIGYNKAARLVEQMEDNGLVTAANHVGKRDILLPEQP